MWEYTMPLSGYFGWREGEVWFSGAFLGFIFILWGLIGSAIYILVTPKDIIIIKKMSNKK
jgi:hypothetical protein